MTKSQPQTEWNLAPLFKSDNDPAMPVRREQVRQASYAFINKWQDRTDYLEDPAVLKQALDEYEAWSDKFGPEGDEGFYFVLRTLQDQNDPKIKAKNQQITDFGNEVINKIQFFELGIAKIKPEQQAQFLGHKALLPYRHWLERLFASAGHQLSESEEKILNLKSAGALHNWVKLTSGFLSKDERQTTGENGSQQTLNYEGLMGLMDSNQPKIRDEASKHFNEIILKYVEVAEAEINAVLLDKKIDDELRKFGRPDASRHLSDDVTSTMVDALIDAVAGRNNIARRYYDLKAKLLGLPQLKYHERNLEYGKLSQKYDYQAALDLVGKVFNRLDPGFAAILDRYVRDGQIDVYPRPGKYGGALCCDNLKPQPTYVLLNYSNTLTDVISLAHEMGHAVNSEYCRQQNALNFGVPMATAEVASKYIEDFVLDELLMQSDDEMRLAILVKQLNNVVSSIFRQIACYKFEQALHRDFRAKGYLSTAEIGKLFQAEMSAYMGPAVEQSPGAENWWVYWSHIRTYFYVYSYAGGLLIAKAMQQATRADHSFVEKVKVFMSAGRSESPQDIFQRLGIDISDSKFWDKGLDEVEALLDEATALAKKLGKI